MSKIWTKTSLTRKKEKLFRFLFQLLVFIIPSQLAYHFWPDWAHVDGVRVDYLAPTIYLTDMLIIILLLTFSWQCLRTKASDLRKTIFSKRHYTIVFFGLLTYSALNIYKSLNYQAALVKWIKIFELVFFTLLIIKEKRIINKKLLFVPFSLTIVYSSIIAIAQFALQRTVGGPLFLLGERSFSAGTPGIALASFFGNQLLRPYATFPHPNVLAGFTLVASIFVLMTETKRLIFRYIKYIVFVFSVITLLLTSSLAVWLSFIVILLIFIFNKNLFTKKPFTISIFLFGILLSIVSPIIAKETLSFTESYPEEFSTRVNLTMATGKILSENPLIGIGFNNFIVKLSIEREPSISYWDNQPVHNIFLLAFVEGGIVGLILFSLPFFIVLKKIMKLKRLAYFYTPLFLVILFTGVVDHYWLTLQQPQLLFSLLIGLSLGES